MLRGAIKNELEKLYQKKKVHVILAITLFFAGVMLAIDFFDNDASQKSNNWKNPLEAQIQEMDTYLNTVDDKASDEYKNTLNQKNKLEFHLKEDINPEVGGAAGSAISSVTGMFIKLILPILIVIITADIITAEASNGTLKSLLVSPMGRKNILFSKWIAVTLVAIGIMLLSDLLTYVTSIPKHGLGNWDDLIVIGTEEFKVIAIWKYMVLGLLLNTLVIITLTSVFLLVSILFSSVSTAISLSICVVVFGGILINLQDKIDSLKYIFVLNLDLMAHFTGEFTLQNTSFLLSSMVMLVTFIFALCLSYFLFTRKDLLV